MRLRIGPTVRPLLFKTLLLSIALACSAGFLLVFLNLSVSIIGLYLNDTIAFQLMTAMGLIVSSLITISIYLIWSGVPFLTDLIIWLCTVLAITVSIGLQDLICVALLSAQPEASTSRIYSICDPNYQRAMAYGSGLAVGIFTLIIWIAIRFAEWQRLKRN